MNKLAIALALAFAAMITFVILSLDNGARPTIEEDEQAQEDWRELSPEEKDLICDVFLMVDDHAEAFELMQDGEVRDSAGLTLAKIDIMERECR